MKKKLGRLCIIVLAAVMIFFIASCDDNSTLPSGINTGALDEVIAEANKSRYQIEIASIAEDVAEGRYWVTQAEGDAFFTVLQAAAEISLNPVSQDAVDTAKSNLEAAVVIFNAAKKAGTGAIIKLSGTITVKNNGKDVPYVQIEARNESYSWQRQVRFSSLSPNTPWEIIVSPLESQTEIFFDVSGYSDDAYDTEHLLFAINVDGLTRYVHNQDVTDININLENLNLITLSGTFDCNGTVLPSVSICVRKKSNGSQLALKGLLSAGNNTPWSITIPSQDSDTDIYFQVVGFKGPFIWEYDQVFAFWDLDCGKVKDTNVSNIKLHFITVSGTFNIDGETTIQSTAIHVQRKSNGELLGFINIYDGGNNTPWTVFALAQDTDTDADVWAYGFDDPNTWNDPRLLTTSYDLGTIKNQNISGIDMNLITLSGTFNASYNGEPVPRVSVVFERLVDGEYWWSGIHNFNTPDTSAIIPWLFVLGGYDSDTEVVVYVRGSTEPDEYGSGEVLFSHEKIVTIKDKSISDITIEITPEDYYY